MSNYWVFPITQDNLDICLEHSIIGASGNNKKRITRIQPGDLIIFYVSRAFYNRILPRIGEFQAVVGCIGWPFKSATKMWHDSAGDNFPTRMPIKVVSRKKCKVGPLIEKLSFIKNKHNWGSAFFSGMRQIPTGDFILIVDAMK